VGWLFVGVGFVAAGKKEETRKAGQDVKKIARTATAVSCRGRGDAQKKQPRIKPNLRERHTPAGEEG